MAYVNVAEWSADQIADWLKGLDAVISQYIPLFLDSEITGEQLLNMRSDDLENLGIFTIGHQELILEAVGQLRNFHYELDRENLQHLALKLLCAATSLYNELCHQLTSLVEAQTLSDVINVIAMVKPLAFWLDRPPFSGHPTYKEDFSKMLRLSIRIACNAARDRFAEQPMQNIMQICRDLSVLATKIIQEISDPMILQPATLDLATLKKREQELGFDILPSCTGIHQVTDIKFISPVHSSGKIEDGDEIVQVNYQTVVGWQPKEVLLLCQESPADILLTLKKRPRHTHTYGQIYMKPYRLPSRKRSMPYNRWGSLPSPRPELMPIKDFEMPLPRSSPVPIPAPVLALEASSSSDESEILSRPVSRTSDHVSSQLRIYLPKPRSVVQRRNTTSGSSPVSKRRNTSIEKFWKEIKNHKSLQHSGSAQMANTDDWEDILGDNLYRDKSLSCSTGLELSPRPKTCLGVRLNHSKVVKIKDKLNMTSDEKNAPKTVKFNDQLTVESNDAYYSNQECESKDQKEPRERGRLDKSFSTPAYDFGENDENDCPLIKEIIPESPTSSIESPSIVVHSPKKIDQILDFKKSSEQIGGAMNFKKSKERKVSVDENGQKVFEIINIALLEHKRKAMDVPNKKGLNPVPTIFETEFGGASSSSYNPGMKEQIETIQNELLEVINEQMKLKSMDLKNVNIDTPPEPPPRPLSTQKPGYIPPKPLKNIQKQDIQVIPNLDTMPPIIPLRKDIPLPINSVYNSHAMHPQTVDASSPKSSVGSPVSLQIFEPEQKPSGMLAHPVTNVSMSSLKSPTLESAKSSISPGNSMVRGILNTGKSKSLKKKNSILAKRRQVSVKELGAGDWQGFLLQRCRVKSSSTVTWEQRWCILTGNTFYGYKHKEALKAKCLIFLSGFTAAPAEEVKSKPFVFKVYHTGTVFYFSCENADSMSAWLEYITRATLTNNDSWERASKKDKKTDESKHFSETDYSDDDLSAKNEKQKGEKQKSEKSHKFGSLKKFASRSHKSESQENVNHASTSLDRKYLGFFTSRYHKNKEEKSKLKSSDTPVPTDQYRSYRKIPLVSTSTSNLVQAGTESQHFKGNMKNTPSVLEEVPDKKMQNVAKIMKIESMETQDSEKDELSDLTQAHQKKVCNPINFIHASNPNLLDYEKSDFVTKPKSNALSPFFKNITQRPDNFIGFVTLEQFMLNKQEEERRQVYSNRVLLGVEKDARTEDKNQNKKQQRTNRDNHLQRQLDKIVPDVIYGEIPTYMEKHITPAKMEQIQNRCLPKTPDIISVKAGKNVADTNGAQGNAEMKTEELKGECVKSDKKKYSKNGQRKKNDGYETIKYDDTSKLVDNNENPVENNGASSKGPSKKLSFNAIKDGYEKIVYGDTKTNQDENVLSFEKEKELFGDSSCDDEQPLIPKNNKNTLKDLGYEMLYDSESNLTPSRSNSSTITEDEEKIVLRNPAVSKKPVPPPKLISKKLSVSRQGSTASIDDRKSSGIDTKPVFRQGDSPEKFWLDSLRRNDKVYASKVEHVSSLKTDKFFTKHSEPSMYMKSSEATIVKSDKLQNKAMSKNDAAMQGKNSDQKMLKSAHQYTPMSLPLASNNNALKTSPQFELSLDSRDTHPTPAFSGISRIKQMFQQSNSTSKNRSTSPQASTPKEKTLLGSPLLHRALFRKHNQPADEWSQDFIYSKGSTVVTATESEQYLFSPSSSASSTSNDTSFVNPGTIADYPHLEYPPVFEPETYTLAHPGPSILRNKNNTYDGEKK